MFSKTADPTAMPTDSSRPTRPAGAGNASKSILGNDLKVTGEITSAGTVEVKGHVDGKITSEEFMMRATAQVAADVTYATVVIESGAQIEGRFSLAKA